MSIASGIISGLRSGLQSGLNPGGEFVVIAGQSNIVGQQRTANITDALRTGIGASYPSVRLKQKMAQALGDPLVWTTSGTADLAEYSSSVPNNTGFSTGLMGPELTLGRHLHFYGRPMNIVKFAVSGSNIATHWNPAGSFPTSPGGSPNLFAQLLRHISEASSELGGRMAAFVWVQGETDAQVLADANNYQTNLTALFNAVRAAYPGVPLIFNRLHTSCAAANTATVRTAQTNVAAAFSNCTMISVDDLTLTDGYHFDANSYGGLGHKIGNAVLDALGVSTAIRPWTIDRRSLVGVPQNATEWAAALAAAGVSSGGPSLLWLCQESSGNLADSIGSFTGTASGTGLTYRADSPIWDSKAVSFGAASTAQITNSSASLPDPSTTSFLRIAYASNLAPPGARNLWLLGTAGFGAVAVTATSWRISDGGNNTDGAANPHGTVRPWVHRRNRTAGTSLAFTNQERLVGTQGAVTGKQVTLGQSGSNPAMGFLYVADFHGAAAEKTDAEIRAILSVLNWWQPWATTTSAPW